jgi:hypothetical protein
MSATVPTTQQPSSAIAPVARQAPTATEMYEAARLARRELRNQQDQLQSERRQVQSQLKAAQNPADIKGLEGRLAVLDGRIADVEKQIASADAVVADRAAVPGVVVVPPSSSGPDIPPEAVFLGSLSMLMIVLLPISIGYARRLWRRGSQSEPVQIPADLSDRMSRIERGVESVAIEVERLGEGQRFVTQLLADQAAQRALITERAEPR